MKKVVLSVVALLLSLLLSVTAFADAVALPEAICYEAKPIVVALIALVIIAAAIAVVLILRKRGRR